MDTPKKRLKEKFCAEQILGLAEKAKEEGAFDGVCRWEKIVFEKN